MPKKTNATCLTCGKTAEFEACTQKCAQPEDARCIVLEGWLSVAYWRGRMEAERYDFCSFTCLQKWVDGKVPRVPESFFKAFNED